MVDKPYLLRIFPDIRQIKSRTLQARVIDVWIEAARQGGWGRIDHIPFTLLVKTAKSLIEHTKAVTRMAMALGKARTDINMDIIIAGGICHDVGKLLEYRQSGAGGKITKSDYGKRVRHPVSGAALARQVALPLEVVHIIAAHSEEGELVVRSKEAIVIHHCDFVDFQIEKLKS